MISPPTTILSCFSLLPLLRTDAKMSYGEDFVQSTTTIPFPYGTTSPTIDFEVNIRGEWVLWSNRLGNDVFNLCVFYFLSFAINYTYTCM